MPYTRSYGFKPPTVTPDNYVFGGFTKLKGEPLVADGNWTPYLPQPEFQSRPYFDTNGCAIYGTLNALETLKKRTHDTSDNWSERFLAVLANSAPSGNDPHTVIEAARKHGLLREASLPFDDSITNWQSWASPKPMLASLLAEARKFLDGWSIGHEWVPDNDAAIAEALKYSPLGVAVYAWTKNDEGHYYFPAGLPRNHWCLLVSQVPNRYRIVFDTYDQVLKRIAWDSKFIWIKRYYLSDSPRVSLIKRAINLAVRLLAILTPPRVEFPPKPELPPAPPAPQPMSKIEQWAKAIEVEEGGKPGDLNTLLKNPGNLKYGELTASWGAAKGRPATDGGFFSEFKTYDDGFRALCNFLELACRDQLKYFHDARTLRAFTQKYANPPANHPYAETVARKLGVKVDVDISTFLS